MIRADHVPPEAQVYAWIEQVFQQGVRRPGYAADRWVEDLAEQQFRALGLERVRREPVELPCWEPRDASLIVRGARGKTSLPCFPLPHTASADGLDADLVAFDPDAPELVRGAIALYDVALMRVPHSWFVAGATSTYDPDGSFASSTHLLPFGRELQAVMEPAIEAGAVGFVGTLSNHPGDSRDYYVPYDGLSRPLPGVWVSGSDGVRLREALARGPLRARLTVDPRRQTITSYNIVGELPGADDEVVIVGSHHDGPWSSAVEDGSGIALVLAQAAYWSHVPQAERPHRLVFLLNAGHMAGGAGAAAFVEAHRGELERVVLEVHLEHAANEFAEQDGELRPTGQPVARWWFTSRLRRLEAAVRSAVEAEDLRRSLMLRPDVFGPRPTTDGSEFLRGRGADRELSHGAVLLVRFHGHAGQDPPSQPGPDHASRNPHHRIDVRRLRCGDARRRRPTDVARNSQQSARSAVRGVMALLLVGSVGENEMRPCAVAATQSLRGGVPTHWVG